ncbi:hypothetical protein [Haloarcula japonica]|uniref:DUF8158 domain-containing protein n=1 Tax=Haloarcula japonica (strain ATCC 49778 / DSM 6131 / JCM 7785 / NBRC 101032 / NCIMB 13157 / TR-1) TaxID=1227453 RepID=M0L381_HALJT|nr:hypothetical protein [Haloarcula japonica]EMA27543.1 hypothetical protein C444_18682 [Haloarcula japonica DSM 6131]
MPDTEPLYNVREQTGNPGHASVDDVIDLVIQRAQNPRTEHEDAHFDTAMAALVDRYGMESVRTVIHRILVDDEPFRTATTDLEMRNVDGVRIGTAASWFLEELNAQDND